MRCRRRWSARPMLPSSSRPSTTAFRSSPRHPKSTQSWSHSAEKRNTSLTTRDIAKLLKKDKDVLRFATRLAPTHGRELPPADTARQFVLSYFLADDTLSVFEPPVRNSGIVGGRFLERIHLPHVTPKDLFVGARLHILHRCVK